MEAELRPQVMETLDTIAETYKKLRKLQDQQVEGRLAPPARCRRPRSAATRN
jgi:RNA polymerase primary sigma factor